MPLEMREAAGLHFRSGEKNCIRAKIRIRKSQRESGGREELSIWYV